MAAIGANEQNKKVAVPPDQYKGKTKRPKTRDPAQEAQDKALAQQRADQLAAERRAIARDNADRARSGRRMLRQADNMNAQARSLQDALKYSFGRNLRQGLDDVLLNLQQQRDQMLLGSKERATQLRLQGAEAEMATGDTAAMGLSNMVRERYDALTGLITQGAGETDSMRAMLMSARNWHANAAENNRGYYDTMRSINASATDLNVDTRTGLANMYMAAEGERDRLWQDYRNKRAESFTQLGNIRGQQADYYEQAREMGVKPKNKDALGNIKEQGQDAYADATSEMGQSYKQRPLPKWVEKYQVIGQQQARQSNTNLAAAVTIDKAQKAEGASLRRWDG